MKFRFTLHGQSYGLLVFLLKEETSSKINTKLEQLCGFWDFNLNTNRQLCSSGYEILHCYQKINYFLSNGVKSGGWSGEGVKLIKERSTNMSKVCHSYHLTSFAVLVSVKHEPTQVSISCIQLAANDNFCYFVACRSEDTYCHILHWLQYINSLLASINNSTKFLHVQVKLLISKLTAFKECNCLCRKILKGSHIFVHLNLCIALLLGNTVFVSGVDTATSNRVC